MTPSSSNPKRHRAMLAILAVLMILGLAALAWFSSDQGKIGGGRQADCPDDVNFCYDGSSVKRTGPNCEFAACPIPTQATTTVPTNVEPLDYNKVIPAAFTEGADWPPSVSSESGQLSCGSSQNKDNPDQAAVEKTIGDRKYCVSVSYDIAPADFVNASYLYRTQVGDNIASIRFSLHYPKCDNYDGDKKTECEQLRGGVNPEVVPRSISPDLK